MRDSIELGLDRLARHDTPQSVVLTPGDYPGITAAFVAQLVEYGANRPHHIVIPIYNGRRGHPIVLPWTIAAQIHSLPAGVGVNALVAEHEEFVVEFDILSPEIVGDLDTPDDLQQWEKRQQEGQRLRGERFRVHVRLFALAKDRAGRSEVEIELAHGSKVRDLRAALGESLPALAPMLATVMISLDEEYAGDDKSIAPGSRLAVIPPVSGGDGGWQMKGSSRNDRNHR
jgi:molybdenum cofactor cytidylyltransferase